MAQPCGTDLSAPPSSRLLTGRCWFESNPGSERSPAVPGHVEPTRRVALRAGADFRARLPCERARPVWREPRKRRAASPSASALSATSRESRAVPTRPARSRARASSAAHRALALDASSPSDPRRLSWPLARPNGGKPDYPDPLPPNETPCCAEADTTGDEEECGPSPTSKTTKALDSP